MDDEIQLISDGAGIAVIGNPGAVDEFLAASGLPSRDLGLPRLSAAAGATQVAAQSGSVIGAGSGRWVQLTAESAQWMKSGGGLMKGTGPGVGRAIVMDGNKTSHILQIVKPGSLLANPAMLAGVAGIMAQVAMQQAMAEITDYLATIDAKVDDVLRNQKDAVVADMLGVHLVIEDAMTVRDELGRVPEITWSKIQGSEAALARTQAYALRQLDGITERLERTTKVGELAKVSADAERQVREWVAVLARCFQLLDAVAVLELDRVLDASPDELDDHRLALRVTRRNRLDLISRSTGRLLDRAAEAIGRANAKVLLNPTASPAVVRSNHAVRRTVVEMHGLLGIEQAGETPEGRRWVQAASDARDRVLESGADGVDAARQVGNDTWKRARSVSGRVSEEISARVQRRRGEGTEPDPEG